MEPLWITDFLIVAALVYTTSGLGTAQPSDQHYKGEGEQAASVMLDPETLDLLSEYISTHNISEFQSIFTLSSVQVWNIVKKYGRMINVDIHPHTFRHSFASTS
jgi:integrase